MCERSKEHWHSKVWKSIVFRTRTRKLAPQKFDTCHGFLEANDKNTDTASFAIAVVKETARDTGTARLEYLIIVQENLLTYTITSWSGNLLSSIQEAVRNTSTARSRNLLFL
jgi:hypothetical protein